jgi:hypothetical protein
VYLLDTNVVSELRKPRPNGTVVAWLQSVEDALPNLDFGSFDVLPETNAQEDVIVTETAWTTDLPKDSTVG